jgi:hypothetical protein
VLPLPIQPSRGRTILELLGVEECDVLGREPLGFRVEVGGGVEAGAALDVAEDAVGVCAVGPVEGAVFLLAGEAGGDGEDVDVVDVGFLVFFDCELIGRCMSVR